MNIIKSALKISWYLFLFLFASSVSGLGATVKLTPLQQKNLVANLNYLQYSIEKIKASDNKAIAEEEYYAVINRLKIGNINDSDLNRYYKRFLEDCAELKLKQNEKDFLKLMNEKERKSAYLNAFSNFGSVFVPGQSPQQLVASLIYTSVSNAFAIAKAKNGMDTQLERDMFYLDQAIMKTIYDSQTSLFTTAAKLLGGNSTAGLLNSDSMVQFIKAINQETNKAKLNALNEASMKKNFSMFPPYWYELGNAYQLSGDNKNALNCYSKFESLKKTDIVDKDKNYINLLKNKIQIYLGKDKSKAKSNALAHKTEILKCITLLQNNYLDTEAGEKNAYLAKIHYLIGQREESLKCLNYIINSNLYPEYMEEAISLKSLIMSDSGKNLNLYYQRMFNFGQARFTDEGIDYNSIDKELRAEIADNTSNVSHGAALNYVGGVVGGMIGGFFGGAAGIVLGDLLGGLFQSDKSAIRRMFCLKIPKSIFENCSSLTISIDGILCSYYPMEDKDNPDEMLVLMDYDKSYLEERTIVSLHMISKATKSTTVANYYIVPVADKYYNAAQKAYSRIGSDIDSKNAEKVVEFGKVMNKYSYEVNDADDLRKDVTAQKQKKGKKNNWTKAEINSEIAKELNNKLRGDIEYIQDRFMASESSYYKQEEVLYSPYFSYFNDNRYLSGLHSVYDSSLNKEACMQADGSVGYVDNSSYSIGLKDYQVVLTKAYSGDLASMYKIAETYFNGGKSYATGLTWLVEIIGTEKNSPVVTKAKKKLAECYQNGWGVVKDKSVAKTILESIE